MFGFEQLDLAGNGNNSSRDSSNAGSEQSK